MSNLSKEQANDMLFRSRSMLARIDGIWRCCTGHYIQPLCDPLTAKVVVNGKEYIVCGSDFLNYDGYNEVGLESSVIAKNIQSLPPAPKRKEPIYRRWEPLQAESYESTTWTSPGMEWAFRERPDGRIETYQRPIDAPVVMPEPFEPPINP